MERIKTFNSRVKDFFKSSKKIIKKSYLKLIESPNFKNFTKTPIKCIKTELKSVNIKKMILSKLGLAFFGYVNAKSMGYREARNLSVLLYSNSLKSGFLLASIPRNFFYVSCLIIKIGLIINSYNTLRSTHLVFHRFLVSYSPKTKSHKVIIQYFLKGRLLKEFYIRSIKLKIFDFLYSVLITQNPQLIKLFFGKYARYSDFSIFLVIIMIQLSYNILDFINLDSSKK
jgi:hypothetical protein